MNFSSRNLHHVHQELLISFLDKEFEQTCEVVSEIMPMVSNTNRNAQHSRNRAERARLWYTEHVREAKNQECCAVSAEKKACQRRALLPRNLVQMKKNLDAKKNDIIEVQTTLERVLRAET